MSVNTNKAQELVSGLGLALKAAQDAAGNGGAARLLNASHDHAQVAGFHDNSNALGLEDFHNGVGNVLGQAFLDLEASRKHFGNAGKLRKANDGIAGNIANVHL